MNYTQLLEVYPLAHQLEDARLTRQACLAERDFESAQWWFNEARKLQRMITNDRRLNWLRSTTR